MPNYVLKNEGEQRPTGITGTPLGGAKDRSPLAPVTREQAIPATGALAVYTSARGERYGVHVLRSSKSWADVRVLRPADKADPENYTRQVSPARLSLPTGREFIFWNWPLDYDYVGKLAALGIVRERA